MELHKGNCAFCKESLVIHCRELQQVWHAISFIFMRHTTNENELKKIRSEFEICPSCAYTLSMIEQTLKDVERYLKKNQSISYKCCLLCGKTTTLYKIKEDYTDLVNILSKYKETSKIRSCMLCNRCFHLTRNSKLMFTQLSVKYPALLNNCTRNSSSPKKNSPTKNTSKPKSKIVKNFNPIKNSSYNLNNVVKSDKKLYKQIPYVKVNRVLNKQKEKSVLPEKIKKQQQKPSFKIKFKKQSSIRSAIKWKTAKTSDLLNLGRVLKVNIVRAVLTESHTTPIKTKGAVKLLNDSPKKSVTFADKNIEIEHKNIDSNSVNDSIDEKSTVSKSILKNKSPVIEKDKEKSKSLASVRPKRKSSFITISSDESDNNCSDKEGYVNGEKSKTDLKLTKSGVDRSVNGISEESSDSKIHVIENKVIVECDSSRNDAEKTNTFKEKRKPQPKSKCKPPKNKNTSDENEEEVTPQKKRKTEVESTNTESENKEKSTDDSDESGKWDIFSDLTSEQLFDQLFKSNDTPKKKYKPRPQSKQKEKELKDKLEKDDEASVSENQNGISADKLHNEINKAYENSDEVEEQINLTESFSLNAEENNSDENAQNGKENDNITFISSEENSDNDNNAKNTEESDEKTHSNLVNVNEKLTESTELHDDPMGESILPESQSSNDLFAEKSDDISDNTNNKVANPAISKNQSTSIGADVNNEIDDSNKLIISNKINDTLKEDSVIDQDPSTSSRKNTLKTYKPRPLSKKKKNEKNDNGGSANTIHNLDNSLKESKALEAKESESAVKELTLSQINSTSNLSDEDNATSSKPSETINDEMDDIDKIVNKYVPNRPSILDSDKKNIAEKIDIDDLIVKDATTDLYDDL